MNKQGRYILLLMIGEPRRVKSQFLPSKALCAGEAFARAPECETSPGLPSKRHLTGCLQWPKPGWLNGSRASPQSSPWREGTSVFNEGGPWRTTVCQWGPSSRSYGSELWSQHIWGAPGWGMSQVETVTIANLDWLLTSGVHIWIV